jgi:hypothetical protein
MADHDDTDPPPNPDDGLPPKPRKLTEDLILAFAELVGQGHFRTTVALKLRVNPATVSRWLRLGREHPGGIYGLFRVMVLEAEADSEMTLLNGLKVHGVLDGKYLAWILERKWPRRWGRSRGDLVEMQRRIRDLEQLVREALAREADDHK